MKGPVCTGCDGPRQSSPNARMNAPPLQLVLATSGATENAYAHSTRRLLVDPDAFRGNVDVHRLDVRVDMRGAWFRSQRHEVARWPGAQAFEWLGSSESPALDLHTDNQDDETV